ncbi:MAG: GNAT family N-acetyltransferase [Bacteroidales bacterium]|nr:GNAT family N-acetyltransferase [Bacteroidales bacterium]
MDVQDIVLRAVELTDEDSIYRYENDFKAWTDGINSRFFSRQAIREYVLQEQNLDAFASQQIRLMADVKKDGLTVTGGCVDLYDMDFKNSKAGVGIYIDEPYRRKGLAVKALDALEDYAFSALNLHQLYAVVRKDNVYCCKAFEKCLYTRSATLKQWIKKGNDYYDAYVYQKFSLL